MDVSVIVPTFNRATRLSILLEDLRSQQAGDLEYEVLVVDNGSADATAITVADRAALDPRIRYLLERRPGASCARNAGIAAATAPILAFIDDDIRPHLDWIASLHRVFEEHPDLDCLGGRIEPRWPTDPPRWLTSAHWGPLALQMGRGRSSRVDREHAAACLVTANFACRASVFRELGGFSPDFRRDEDREFNLRMWRAGKRGLYADSVVTYTDVQSERLDKRYHRAWHHVTGQSHARMRYRDSITPEGALDESMTCRGWQFGGIPGFLYREWVAHAVSYVGKVGSGRLELAFFDECRLRYLSSYFVQRWRDRLASCGRGFRRTGVPTTPSPTGFWR
jgi:glycosyltransferase involved in cell wall biosynthesis